MCYEEDKAFNTFVRPQLIDTKYLFVQKKTPVF